MCATVCAAVLNVALNIAFLPLFGYIASAYATLASCCLLTALQYTFSARLGVSSALDNRLSLALSVLQIAAGLSVNVTYGATSWIRYALFMIIFLAAIANRKRLFLVGGKFLKKSVSSRF